MNRQVPQGIEVLVKKASVDPAFRAMLLQRRAAVAEEIGLELDATESMLLAAVPAEQLEAIIASTCVPESHRRAFLGYAATAMLAAIGVVAAPDAASGGGGTIGSFGNRPVMSGAGGIRPETWPAQKQPEESESLEFRVTAIVAKEFDVERKTLARETTLAKDLRASASERTDLRKKLEREFSIDIPSAAFGKLKNLGEITDYVQKALQKKSNNANKPSTRKSSAPPSK